MRELSVVRCVSTILAVVILPFVCYAQEPAEKKTYNLELKPCLTDRFYLYREKKSSRWPGEPKQEPERRIRIVRYWAKRVTRKDPGKWLSCRYVSHPPVPDRLWAHDDESSYVVSTRNRSPGKGLFGLDASLFGVPLPAKAVETGATWQKESNMGRVFADRPEEYVLIWRCRLKGLERHRGKEYVRIDYTQTTELKGKGQALLSVSLKGHVLFDPSAGLFVKKREVSKGVWKTPVTPGGPTKPLTTTMEGETILLIPESHAEEAGRREKDE
jgi:hypothetical protein